ncbi:hypothetical protein BDK51DRAFT_50518 [Blyttiomyces helicus]|uniref:Uncharacterized protein n=1 Tax=Blyttiomyces helicus TaxID=388810 RepID=A0A4P9VUV5_9FUNG|nr:hypothetical protein BDK51DRAFT_50518 [Blyttiomyces helicus]|eukprot:RKO82892.1 hypothetical protein BDK51DRAFT_50518 [Blyttiomyces helicus]
MDIPPSVEPPSAGGPPWWCSWFIGRLSGIGLREMDTSEVLGPLQPRVRLSDVNSFPTTDLRHRVHRPPPAPLSDSSIAALSTLDALVAEAVRLLDDGGAERRARCETGLVTLKTEVEAIVAAGGEKAHAQSRLLKTILEQSYEIQDTIRELTAGVDREALAVRLNAVEAAKVEPAGPVEGPPPADDAMEVVEGCDAAVWICWRVVDLGGWTGEKCSQGGVGRRGRARSEGGYSGCWSQGRAKLREMGAAGWDLVSREAKSDWKTWPFPPLKVAGGAPLLSADSQHRQARASRQQESASKTGMAESGRGVEVRRPRLTFLRDVRKTSQDAAAGVEEWGQGMEV